MDMSHERTEDALDRTSRRYNRGYYGIVPDRFLATALARHGGAASLDLMFNISLKVGWVWV
jgi:hypothetical protein